MEMKMTYCHGPLDNPSHGQPQCLGPFTAPFQQEVVIEETSSSLFLMAARAIIRGGT
jgi:hypothetical protein